MEDLVPPEHVGLRVRLFGEKPGGQPGGLGGFGVGEDANLDPRPAFEITQERIGDLLIDAGIDNDFRGHRCGRLLLAPRRKDKSTEQAQ